MQHDNNEEQQQAAETEEPAESVTFTSETIPSRNESHASNHPNDTHSILSDYEIFRTLKRLSSFMNRKYVIASTVKWMARNLARVMRREREMENIHPCVYSALSVIGQENNVDCDVPPDSRLCNSLLVFLLRNIQDRQGETDRHRCRGQECATHCILPMFAQTCYTHRQADQTFERLKSMVEGKPSLICTNQRTNEAQTAINLLRYIASKRDPSLSNTYGTLLAMAGHQGTIFNPKSKVDSRLYERLFDLFRSYDYSRLEEMYDDLDPEIFKTPSVSLLDVESSQILKDHIVRIERNQPGFGLPGLTYLSSEPSDVSFSRSSNITSPSRNNGSYLISSPFGTSDITNSADPGHADPDDPPSYHSVIPSVHSEAQNRSPLAPREELHADDELPTYEQTQEVAALFSSNRSGTLSAPSVDPHDESEVDNELPTYEQVVTQIVERFETNNE